MRAALLPATALLALASACEATHNLANVVSGDIEMAGPGDFEALPANCPLIMPSTQMPPIFSVTNWGDEAVDVDVQLDGDLGQLLSVDMTEFTATPGIAVPLQVSAASFDSVGDLDGELQIVRDGAVLASRDLNLQVTEAGILTALPADLHISPGGVGTVQMVNGWGGSLYFVAEIGMPTGSVVFTPTTGDCDSWDGPLPPCAVCGLSFQAVGTGAGTATATVTGSDPNGASGSTVTTTITLESP